MMITSFALRPGRIGARLNPVWRPRLWMAIALLVVRAAEGGGISGRVRSQSGTSLSNIFLDLYDEAGEWFDFTTTDSTGRYQFSNLGQGVFYVHTDTLGAYADEWFNDIAGASDRAFFDPLGAGATAIDVPLLSTVTGIDFYLAPAASVRGTVRTEGGGAIPDVYVDAYLLDGTRFRSALTAADGAYEIDGLPVYLYGAHEEGTNRVAGYRLVATASWGAAGTAERVERSIEARVTKCKNPNAAGPDHAC